MTRSDVIERFIGELAQTKGISADDLLQNETDKPYFETAIEARAKSLGVAPKDLLDRDLDAMLSSDYPGPDCLRPADVSDYVQTGELSNPQIEHITSCEACNDLMPHAKPKPERIEAFLEEVRKMVPEAVAHDRTKGKVFSDKRQSGAAKLFRSLTAG